MRFRRGRLERRFVVLAFTILAAAPAAAMHPAVSQLRGAFPSLSLDSNSTFSQGATVVGGRSAAGLRATQGVRSAEPQLEILYPQSYDGLIVAELGQERVMLRPLSAVGAAVSQSDGTLIYTRPYRSVDVVEVPGSGRSEEFLLLQDQHAPVVFEYEIVATEGIARTVLQNGAIRFLPELSSPSTSAVGAGHFLRPPVSLQIDAPWLIDASGKRSRTEAHWTLIGEGPVARRIRLSVSAEHAVFPVVVDPSFSATGSMGTARYGHSVTLLSTGKVLIAGGFNGGTLRSAELYDPATGTCTPTGSLLGARSDHTATPLPDGTVLVAGGASGSSLRTAELYDPKSGTFTATGNLIDSSTFHTATLLLNGKVLIAGGVASGDLSSAELYDPATKTFTATGSMTVAREAHTATLLADGKVLIVGGKNSSGYLQSAEVYDPSTGTFTATTGMPVSSREFHTATRLTDGTVLIAGGLNGAYLQSAELYDPASGTFTAVGSLIAPRYLHTATLLPDGQVLITGGHNSNGSLATAELYDPASQTFASAGSFASGRESHAAVLLPNGRVLIAGGTLSSTPLATIDLYDWAFGSFSHTANMGTFRAGDTQTLLPNGKVLIAGGDDGASVLASCELYDPASGTFSPTASLSVARVGQTATLLSNGRVLIAGGNGGGSANLSSAELYDPDSGTFSATGSLGTARESASATLLPDGKVLIAGGVNTPGDGTSLASAELYDPQSGTFSATGSMAAARYGHTATLLPSGRVLIAGGTSNLVFPAPLTAAELYDPTQGIFVPTGSMTTGRMLHTASLLPNGTVFVAAGEGASSTVLSSTELYDPGSGAWSSTGGLTYQRRNHVAVLLGNGTVLIAAGDDGASTFNTYAELYDPAHGTCSVTAGLFGGRDSPGATLLPNGEVLIAGGTYAGNPIATAELYDLGLGFSDSLRPVITSATSISIPAALSVIGSGFRGGSETSSGGTNGSATDFPLLQLERIDNEQSTFLAPTGSWSDVAWSAFIDDLPEGAYRATIFTGAIPAESKIVEVVHAIPTVTTVSPIEGPKTGGQTVTITGTNLLGIRVTIGGAVGTVVDSSSTSATFITPSHDPAVVDLTVTTPAGASANSAGAYTYLADPPTNVVASATTRNSVSVTWMAAPVASSYEVLRSTDGTHFASLGTTSGLSFPDSAAQQDTAYLYAVRVAAPVASGSVIDLATTVIFTDPTLVSGTTVIKAAHLTELRTAVAAVAALAGQTAPAFTDPTINPGVTAIRAVHIEELRTFLDAARAALQLPAISYSQPAIAPGVTPVRALDIEELRAGVQ